MPPTGSQTRRTRQVAAAVAVLLGLVLVTSCGQPDQSGGFRFVSPGGQTELTYEGDERQPLVGFAGEDLLVEGRQITLGEFEGQVVVLNLWGSWCGPCRDEADDLQRVYEETRASGVAFLGINFRDAREPAADFARDYGITYPSIFDQPGRSLFALGDYPRTVVPSTIVLDRQHRVAKIFLKALLYGDLLPVVQAVAAESPPPAEAGGGS